MLDVVDRHREGAFMRVSDALLELLGIEAVVSPDDTDDRDVDRRENIRRRPQQNQRCQQNQQQRGHHKRVRPAKGESDNPHKG